MSAFTKNIKSTFNKFSDSFGYTRREKALRALVDTLIGGNTAAVLLASALLITGAATLPLGVGIPLAVGGTIVGAASAHKLLSLKR